MECFSTNICNIVSKVQFRNHLKILAFYWGENKTFTKKEGFYSNFFFSSSPLAKFCLNRSRSISEWLESIIDRSDRGVKKVTHSRRVPGFENLEKTTIIHSRRHFETRALIFRFTFIADSWSNVFLENACIRGKETGLLGEHNRIRNHARSIDY